MRHAAPTSPTQPSDEAPAEDLLRDVEQVDLTRPAEVLEVLTDATRSLLEGFVARLPLFVLALAAFLLALVLIRFLMRGIDRGLHRARADHEVQRLVSNLTRVALLTGALLMALSIAGVEVGAALAAIGLVGLALAFALQNILENLVAGVLILLRRPFRRGDQILTNEFEGTVEDIDLRVTRLLDYSGEVILVPNATVFTQPVVNLTRRGRRRTTITVGIDYRDDHERARRVLQDAVDRVPGVLSDPPADVLLNGFGASSVDFLVRFWSDPDIGSVLRTKDAVLSAAKTDLDAAGLTIPWPIRTLAADRHPLEVTGQPFTPRDGGSSDRRGPDGAHRVTDRHQ